MAKRFLTLCASVLMLTMCAQAQTTKASTFKGWVSDYQCALQGKKNCSDRQHVANGSKLVIVTDGDNKIWIVTNPASVADYQGRYIQVRAITDPGKSVITVQTVKAIKEGT